MKKLSVSIGVWLWLSVFCFSICAQDFRTISGGIEYAEMKRGTETEPVKINLLRLDLTKVRLDVVHALDAAIGLETVSSMATRHGALAAINAGFFRLDKSIFAGDAAGVLMIDGKLLSESASYEKSGLGRACLMIANKRKQTYVSMERMRATNIIHTKSENFIVGTNRERYENEIVIFTKTFSDTTLTDDNGLEFIVENNKVIRIADGKGNNKIPENGYVISASGKLNKERLLKALKIGVKAQLIKGSSSANSNYNPPAFFIQSEDIISGVPQLVKNGVIEITWQQEKYSKADVETRHPRTAVAKLKDDKFLMVTVDGRQTTSVGMNLNELAALLVELGATDAMNLDGGGSTTMYLNGKVVNRPSDKEGERKVGDAILVSPRR